jgi:hypothetical protein
MEGNVRKNYPINVDLEELQKYGIGIVLFYKFLKYMGFAFLVMFLLAIPQIVLSYLADGVIILLINK